MKLKLLIVLAAALMAATACSLTSPLLTETPDQSAATQPAQTQPATLPTPRPGDTGISAARMLLHLDALTHIQPYSGWRSGGTAGEQEARAYVMQQLSQMEWLMSNGMTVTEEPFDVFMATEFHQSQLEFALPNGSVTVPASAMRGHRDIVEDTLRMDSDGVLNDTDTNPVKVSGSMVFIHSQSDLAGLPGMTGKVAVVDYGLVDTVLNSNARNNAARILASGANGVILITQFSNAPDASHGTFAGEGGAFASQSNATRIPILIARWEDITAAGILDADILQSASNATLTWDVDVLSPAKSGNVVAHIPGRQTERALIIGGHLDSPNSPGAMDDGSGAVITLEVAAYLNNNQIQPEHDLYLVWFGSEELGLYGSAAFTAAHQELLDRTAAVTTFDCLTRPVDGIPAQIMLMFGGDSPYNADPWALHLQAEMADAGVDTDVSHMPLSSDNGSFSGYAIPNVDVIYTSSEMEDADVWFAGHMHDPYDTVELAAEMQDVLVQMAQVAVTAATQTSLPDLALAPAPTHRAVVISSHNQVIHQTPTMQFDFGMLLAAKGWDVDLVPYGTAVTDSDLQDADFVVALPVLDYLPADASGAGDGGWTAAELSVFKDYVSSGGLLMVTNTASRLKYYNRVYDRNEDRLAQNTLAGLFGATFVDLPLTLSNIDVVKGNALTAGFNTLLMAEGSAVPFTLSKGTILAGDPSAAILAVTDFGSGEVILLGDLSALGSSYQGALNPEFIENLAAYAAGR